MIKRHKAQSTLEYVILVTIIVAAFVATQAYIKRGFQGRWKETMDSFADQYDPNAINSQVHYSLLSNSDTSIQASPATDSVTGRPGFITNRVDTTSTVESKNVDSTVGAP